MTFLSQLRYALWIKALREPVRFARLRLIWWYIVRRYESELCQRCGRPVGLVFHAPDAIWERITGEARSPGGEAGGGVLCPYCVDDLATAKGLPFLRWTCATDDSVMRG